MRRGIIAALSTAAVILTGALPAAAAGAGVACGDTITGTVTLQANLTCTDVGLVLAAGATLDLGGHTLRGPGTGGTALLTDEEMPSTSPVTVRNGTIKNWGSLFVDYEFRLLYAHISDVTVRSVAGDVLGGIGIGVTVERSTFRDASPGFFWGGSLDISDSTFIDSRISGGPTIPDITVSGSSFTRSTIDGSCTDGGRITVSDSSFRQGSAGITAGWCRLSVTGSSFRDLGTAIQGDKNIVSLGTHTLVGNTFVANGTALELGHRALVQDSEFVRNGVGIHSETSSLGFPVEDIIVERNTFTRNGDGVIIDTLSHVGDNTATHNTGFGLYVPQAVDLGGNVASHNGVDCVGVVCTG
ncbi:hypothetical protein OEB99_12445 [Actinotalea sp. M2MS4P-6]|uniref:hypothetical protein n=1 Tax=Actinotalea sp. M2MS4P-6 TaxID=2983762 RepID=UPI0021E3EB30|nr:hypothetical protein [Actinotalea sp. M2MS4P-6]MCV2395118.1 hypothetical protein [Actinotalea sp. M2MS4P-6]